MYRSGGIFMLLSFNLSLQSPPLKWKLGSNKHLFWIGDGNNPGRIPHMATTSFISKGVGCLRSDFGLRQW